MQDLAGIRAVASKRVVAELASVPVASALLGVPVDLGDEAVDVDRQPRLARPGARPPRTGQRLTAPSTRASIPSRRPSATASTIPALTTTRSSSKRTSRPIGRVRGATRPAVRAIDTHDQDLETNITISARPGPAHL